MTDVPARTVLLDACALLDLTSVPDNIDDTVREQLSDLSTKLLVSAATAWEIAIKTRSGKLFGGDRLLTSWEQSLIDLQADSIAIDHHDAIRAGGLPWTHRDPFDRMLVAQARRYNVSVATSDNTIIEARIIDTIDTRR